MTYAMGKVIRALMDASPWVQSLITFSDILEALQFADDYALPEILEGMARERRANK